MNAAAESQRQESIVKFAAAKQGRIEGLAEQARLMVMAAGSRAVISDSRLENFLALTLDNLVAVKHLRADLPTCPACNGLAKVAAGTVHSCQRCDAVFTSYPIEREDALKIVALMDGLVQASPFEPLRHFDVDVIDLDGRLQRHHGWMNDRGKVVQWG